MQMTPEMNDVITNSFLHNPMFGINIFKSDRRRLSALMKLCLLYYFRFGIVYSLRDNNNKIVALSLWNAPGTKFMDIWALLTRGFFLTTIHNLFIIGPKILIRALYADEINIKHHIREPHYYLFMLASIEHRCGRILLNKCRETFRGNALYWESSVPKNNHAYYKSFGAEMIGEEIIYGMSNAYFIWR